MSTREQTCCFTGHRTLSDTIGMIKRKLKKTIISLIEKGVIFYGSGGAIGFDTVAALTVLELKKDYPDIKLIMVLPCHEQEKKWSETDKERYFEILKQADKIKYVSEHYHRGCMHERNRYLVDNSGHCIAYLNQDNGGTFYTVNYAEKNGLQIVNLA